MRIVSLFLFSILLWYCRPVFSQKLGYRKYKADEKYRYRLTVETYTNGALSSKEVSVSEHTVLKDSGVYKEEIKWLKKIRYSGKDSADFSAFAKSVKPYRISLAKKGKVLLPPLSIPEMTGDITDLNTFFVSVAPALKIQQLRRVNQVIQLPGPVRGFFSDGSKILRGEDCTEVTQELLQIEDSFAVFKTVFRPPPSFCLNPMAGVVPVKIFSEHNNFQMLQSAGENRINFLWGVENFTVITRTERRTGKITAGTMTNQLRLRAGINAAPGLGSWQFEMPLEIVRKINLVLL